METIWRCLALAFTVICLCLQCVWGCEGLNPKFGNMTTDQELEVGSTLTITCTLFSNVIPRNGTEYYVNSQNLMIRFKNIFLQNLEVIDSRTIQYTKENATVNDTGFYNCFISIPEDTYNTFICSTGVSVGFKPLPAENFSCISVHFQLLNCSWENPFNPVKTKYELVDILSIGITRRCAQLNNSYCIWTLASSPPYRKSSKKLVFKLIGRNSLGTNERMIRINHFEIVKPDHPRKLTFSNLTKTSVKIQWFNPKGMEYGDFPPGLDFWLHYCPSSGSYPELCGIANTTHDTSCVLTNLVPNIEYRVSVRCRSTVSTREDMWSEFQNATFQTLPDEPHLAPETCNSSFEVQIVGHVMRDIILYWKPIPSKFEYGSNFHYVVHYHNHYRRPRYKRETVKKNVGNVTSHTFRLDVETAYLFQIFAVNSAGTSTNSSVIIVDKGTNMLKGPSDIAVLSFGHGKYTVSWKTEETSATNSSYFTLFWCRDIRPRPFKCAGPLGWLDTREKFHELTLPDNSTNYQFAVSTNIDGYTSGMTWASCIVPYGGILYGVKNILLQPKNATSIQVRWILDCNAQKSVIQQYRISYCAALHGLCLETKASVLLNDSDVDQYIVRGLRPYTRYKFGVQARTVDGWSEENYFKSETTLSAAPSGPPRNVKATLKGDTVIRVTFQPPLVSNGIITRYMILYGLASGTSEKHRLHFPVEKVAQFYEAEIKNRVFFYTNYSIEVEACVDLLCSASSKAVYVRTGIGRPEPVEPPRTQIINTTMVNVTWKQPNMPNGPIDAYLVSMVWQDENNTEEKIHRKIFNVTDNFIAIEVTCPEQLHDGLIYYFSIEAVNVKNGSSLISAHSNHSQARLCYGGLNGISPAVLAGLVAGIAFGFILFVFVIYALAKWMKKKVDMVKSITVQLPSGLDSPIENPLNSYDKFKRGLQINGDSGIPSEHTYERLFSYASDKSSKDFDNFYGASSEEFLNSKTGREKSGRNRSGDSTASGKCHDSISSSNTNKTHLSIDSGAEMDLPQSPDGIFSDTSSSNTTPRSYKPDLEIVEESNASSSKDSGLEKEGLGHSSPNVKTTTTDITNGFPYYIRKKKQPYFNVQMLKKNGQIQPYSKFAIIAPAFAPKYVSYGVHNLSLLNQQSLANSEPSVADAQEEEDDDDSEPLMLSGVPPYCRFGLARSAGNGINIVNQSARVQPNLGYSKFGIIYSTMGQQDDGSTITHNQNCIPTYSKIACPSVIQNPFAQKLFLSTPVAMKPLPDSMMPKQSDSMPHFKSGVPTPEKKPMGKGYVSFNHALNSPALELHCSGGKIIQDSTIPSIIPECPDEKSSDEADDTIDSTITDVEEPIVQQTPPQRPTNSYVSFQDAKVMTLHDPLPAESGDSALEKIVQNPYDARLDVPKTCVEETPNTPTENECKLPPPSDMEDSSSPTSIDAYEIAKPCLLDDNNSSESSELHDKESLCDNVVQSPDLESCSTIGPSPLHDMQDSEISGNLERTIPENPSTEHSKPKSNGYVPWAELLDKPSNFASVKTLPNSTSSTDVAKV